MKTVTKARPVRRAGIEVIIERLTAQHPGRSRNWIEVRAKTEWDSVNMGVRRERF